MVRLHFALHQMLLISVKIALMKIVNAEIMIPLTRLYFIFFIVSMLGALLKVFFNKLKNKLKLLCVIKIRLRATFCM